MTKLKVAIDIDNTIIDYSNVYARICNRFNLSFKDPNYAKNVLRDSIYNKMNKENADKVWHFVQANAYGGSIHLARFYKGLLSFVKETSHDVTLVSHKSKYSYSKKRRYNLHESCKSFFQGTELESLIKSNKVIFCESHERKIEALEKGRYDIIIDDLAKVINDERLSRVNKIFFMGKTHENKCDRSIIIESWQGISVLLDKMNDTFSINSIDNVNHRNDSYFIESKTNKMFIKRFSKNDVLRSVREACHYRLLSNYSQIKTPKILGAWENGILLEKVDTLEGTHWDKLHYQQFKAALKTMMTITKNSKLVMESSDSIVFYSDYLRDLNNRLDKIKLKSQISMSDIKKLEDEIKVLEFEYEKSLKTMGLQLNEKLSLRCFTFSDLSSENILVTDECIHFIDLESSGLDDPLKMLMNIYHHPRSKFSSKETFIDIFSEVFGNELIKRFKVTLPVWEMNWLLIKLQREIG